MPWSRRTVTDGDRQERHGRVSKVTSGYPAVTTAATAADTEQGSNQDATIDRPALRAARRPGGRAAADHRRSPRRRHPTSVGRRLPGVGTGGVGAGSRARRRAPSSGSGARRRRRGGATGRGRGAPGDRRERSAAAGGPAAAAVARPGGGGGGGGGGGDTSHCVDDRQFDPAIDFYAPPCVPDVRAATTAAPPTRASPPRRSRSSTTSARATTPSTPSSRRRARSSRPSQRQAVRRGGREVHQRELRAVRPQGRDQGRPGQLRHDPARQPVPAQRDAPDRRGRAAAVVQVEHVAVVGDLRRAEPPRRLQRRRLALPRLLQRGARAVPLGRADERHRHGPPRGPVVLPADGEVPDRVRRHRATRPRTSTAAPACSASSPPTTPRTRRSVEIDLAAELGKCGAGYGGRFYFYAQDITTADQQRRAAVLKMRSGRRRPRRSCASATSSRRRSSTPRSSSRTTTRRTSSSGPGFMDTDVASQAYMGTLGCPVAGTAVQRSRTRSASRRSARRSRSSRTAAPACGRPAGGQGNPPYDVGDRRLGLLQHDRRRSSRWPVRTLTPQTVAEGAARLGCRGGGDTGQALRCFEPGTYSWNQDMRLVYWSTKTSEPVQRRGRLLRRARPPHPPRRVPGRQVDDAGQAPMTTSIDPSSRRTQRDDLGRPATAQVSAAIASSGCAATRLAAKVGRHGAAGRSCSSSA